MVIVRASAVGTDVQFQWVKVSDPTFSLSGDTLYFDSITKQDFG
jgi:hypothetical protein